MMPISPAMRMAGQLAASLGIVAGVPAVIARKHGESAGFSNPATSGIGGTVGYGLLSPLVTPMAAIAYGQGHQFGREKAKAIALQQQRQQQQVPTMQPVLPINY
jgi:hypothetical protein